MREGTFIPNVVLDSLLPTLTESELKILLIVIRQTYGWVDKYTGKRKTKDRISRKQFMQKTGLSRRVVSVAIQGLVDKGLILITDYFGNPLLNPLQRKGVTRLFYSPRLGHFMASTRADSGPSLGQISDLNKRNYAKENWTKERGGRVRSVGEVLSTFEIAKVSD